MTAERLIELYLELKENTKTAYENRILCAQQIAKKRTDAIEVSNSIYSDCIEKGLSEKDAQYHSASYYDSTMNSYNDLYEELDYWEKVHSKSLEKLEIYEMAIKYMSGGKNEVS